MHSGDTMPIREWLQWNIKQYSVIIYKLCPANKTAGFFIFQQPCLGSKKEKLGILTVSHFY